jgi:outer membrane biosynthesis protein TonB
LATGPRTKYFSNNELLHFEIESAQDKRAKDFEKLVAGTAALFVNGERVYRSNEVSLRAIVTDKPEPQFTNLARKKKTHGTVEIRAVLKSTGELTILNVLKRLPNGLTEQALDAAPQIKFKPALLDGKPVSQIIILQYNFNRN